MRSGRVMPIPFGVVDTEVGDAAWQPTTLDLHFKTNNRYHGRYLEHELRSRRFHVALQLDDRADELTVLPKAE